MALESGTYISDLVATNPVGSTDAVSTLDGHIQLLKSTIKATFPNVSGAVTPTHTELNYVDGVTSAIQTQLDALSALGTGRWVQLNSQTVSVAAAAVEFKHGTNGVVLDNTYDEYEVGFLNVLPATAGDLLWMRTSTDAGSNYDVGGTDYEYAAHGLDSSATVLASAATNATKIVLSLTGLNSSQQGFCGRLRLYNPENAARLNLNWSGGYYETTSADMVTVSGSGARKATADVDAIQFLFSSGNIASGTFVLFGRKKS